MVLNGMPLRFSLLKRRDHLLKAKHAAERKEKNKEGIGTGKRRKPSDKFPLPPSKWPVLADLTFILNQDLDDMMTARPSAPPMEADEPVPAPKNSSNEVPLATSTQEALESEWLNKRRLVYQKGKKHATNLQKKGQEKDIVAGPGMPMYDFYKC